MCRSMNHQPAVYALPAHHHLDKAPELKPCADMAMILSKYKIDVCSILGIPPELITSVQHNNSSNKSANTTVASTGTSRIFQAKMQSIANFLKILLVEVYSTIYKGAEAQFDVVPMPRLEINGIEDLKILHEIGVLQPEHTVDLASLMLGKLKKAKKNPLNTFGQVQQEPAENPQNKKQKADKPDNHLKPT